MNIPLSYTLLFQLVQAWDKEINTEPLSSYYPIAEDRSFGDIDIFSFGDHDKVNTFIRKKGIEIEYDDKHDVFKYDGITIEHHKSFFRINFQVSSHPWGIPPICGKQRQSDCLHQNGCLTAD